VYILRDGTWRRFAGVRPIPLRGVIQGDRVEWSNGIADDWVQTMSLHGGTPRGISFTHRDTAERCVYHLDGDTFTLISGDRKETYRRKR
jgi:hypothetical protein